ncbi:MAG: hypothetical protein LUE92_03935 [Clostridiales bacterium]|nr:hypothetical protein [Clostridiales bacterium]
MECTKVIIPLSELSEQCMKYMVPKCGWEREGKNVLRARKKSEEIFEEFFSSREITVYMGEFGSKQVCGETLRFGEREVPCKIFQMVKPDEILGGYVYVCHSVLLDTRKMKMSEAVLADSLQISVLDAVRDYMECHLREKILPQQYLSTTVMPGFYGMPVESIGVFLDELPEAKTKIHLLGSGLMEPLKSIMAIHLVSAQPIRIPSKDCQDCMAGSGCNYCKNWYH